jgi:peptidoglycan-associated lipoprotein
MGAPPPPPVVSISALETVYFDFDQSTIRSDDAATLRKNALRIKENAHWGEVTVQGHTDERGSEEYNLALGERRASAVKRYLVDLGVPESRLRVVSFGEAKAAVPGHSDSAWRYNRRSEFSN